VNKWWRPDSGARSGCCRGTKKLHRTEKKQLKKNRGEEGEYKGSLITMPIE